MRFRDLVQFVVADLPQIPTATVVFELREAAREFCRRSRVWSDELLPVMTEAGRARYAFNVPDGSEVCQINGVWLAGEELPPMDPVPARKAAREGDACPFFWAPNFADLWVNPVPAVSGLPIVAEVVLRPNFSTDTIPDEVVAGRERVISYGAMAKLMAMKDKEWTDPGAASLWASKFEAGIEGAAVDMASGGVAGSMVVQSYDIRAL